METNSSISISVDARSALLTLKVIICEYEYLKAYFFTRWYWKRKHKKAKAELEKYESVNK